MFRFAKPEYLNLLFLIPLLIFLGILIYYYRKKKLSIFAEKETLKFILQEHSHFRQFFKFLIMILAFASIVIAIARPQFGSQLKEVKREGVELVIALDVSNSMLARDIKPNRLERAKRAVSRLVDRLHHDRIGLVVFAGDAYTQVPLTTDYAAYKMMLATVSTNTVAKQGTAIGTAITHALNSFNMDNDMGKAIIIITDGESHEDDPLEAAKKSGDMGVQVYTIGLGSSQGAPIPSVDRGRQGYQRDQQGEIVITQLDEKTLQQIASAGNGKYIRGTDVSMGLNMMFDEISKMEKGEIEVEMYADYEDKFQYFIVLALFFLLWEFFISERKSRWLQKLKIFKT